MLCSSAQSKMAQRRSSRRSVAVVIAAASATQIFLWLNQPASTSGVTFAAPCIPATVGPAGSAWGLQSAKQRPAASSISQQNFGCSLASEPIRHALHLPVRIQQFWDHWIGPVNLDRQGLRISGLEDYAVVSSVIMSLLIGFYQTIQDPEEGCTRQDRIIYDLQMALMMCSVLASTFTMVLFLLNKITDVTALGLYKDVAYATFTHATMNQRLAAFWCIYASMLSFLLCFAMDLLRRIKGKRGLAAKVLTIVGSGVMVVQWTKLVVLAQRFLFQGAFLRIG